jgi:dihydroflavonol-4-reductase
MREVVSILREAGYGRYRLPTARLDSALGNALVVLGSYLRPTGLGAYLRTHVGRVPRYDNGRIQRELGLRFRDVRGTIVETVADLERWGHLKPAPA